MSTDLKQGCSQNRPRRFAASGLLCRIARWLVRRKINNALTELRTAQKYESVMTEEQANELANNYVRLLRLEIQMRHNVGAEPRAGEQNKP